MLQKKTENKNLTSLRVLSEKVQRYLIEKHDISKCWFPDYEKSYNKKTDKNDIVDVVLTGSYYRKLLDTSNWNGKKFRLWVLSESVKRVCSNFYGIEENHIGVINRYELFPKSAKPVNLPLPSSSWDAVYSGRISAAKNICLFIRMIHHLQKEFGYLVRPVFVGYFDNLMEPISWARKKEDFREKVFDLIDSLDWNIMPTFIGSFGPYEWTEKEFNHPVLVSCSNYVSEDFGVSVAQAEACGWPSILSDWGGHSDVTGDNIIKIPAEMFGNPYEKGRIMSARAFAMASLIDKKLRADRTCLNGAISLGNNSVLPEFVSSDSLEKIASDMVLKFGLSVMDVVQNRKIGPFANTTIGMEFFGEYRRLFSRSNENCRNVIFIDDSDFFDIRERKYSLDMLEMWMKRVNNENEYCRVFTRSDLKLKHVQRELAGSSKIILLIHSKKTCKRLIDFIGGICSSETEIITYEMR